MSEAKKVASSLDDLKDLQDKKADLLIKVKSGQAEGVAEYRRVKKEIARSKTLMRLKELAENAKENS